MNNKYQKSMDDAPDAHGRTVPENGAVAMTEIAGSMRAGGLALAVGAGLQVRNGLYDMTRASPRVMS